MVVNKIFSFFGYLIANIWRIVAVALFIGAIVLGMVYGYGSVSDWYEQKVYKANFQAEYNTPENLQKAQSEALKAYYKLTDEQLEDISEQDQLIDAVQLATKLRVYDFRFDIKTSTTLYLGTFTNSEFCIDLKSFEHDAAFDQFKINPKWEAFYGLDLFASRTYDITYKSNLYQEFNQNLPLQYYEDHTKSFSVDESAGTLTNQVVRFSDRMQVVLMDSNADLVPDDTDLVLKIEAKSIRDDGKEYYKTWNIPLNLRNGEVKVSQGGLSCVI